MKFDRSVQCNSFVYNCSVIWSFALGQTQCQRLAHEWGLGKGITEAKALFGWAYQHGLSAVEQCFSLTAKQPQPAYKPQKQPAEQGESLTPAEILQRDGFEPRTWWLGELALTNFDHLPLDVNKFSNSANPFYPSSVSSTGQFFHLQWSVYSGGWISHQSTEIANAKRANFKMSAWSPVITLSVPKKCNSETVSCFSISSLTNYKL
jgi:hypothetical protein